MGCLGFLNTYINEAKNIFEKSFGDIYNLNKENKHELLSLFSNYAFICGFEGDTDEAEKYYRFLIDNSNPQDLIYQTSCNGLSMLIMGLGNYKESIKYLQRLHKLKKEKIHLFVSE